jgi:hypothetical protein
MLESEKEWRARVATKAPSPDSANAAATKQKPVSPPAAQAADEAEDDYADEYNPAYTGGMGAAGTGLKTNMLLTADTLPPDVYGQPRRFVPTVPALRPDHVVSTVPNVQYAVVEGPARRRLRGMASNSLDLMPTPGSSAPQQFLVHPGMLDFGAVPEGGTYKMTINLTNISVEMARFRVRQVPNALIKLNYKPGPVMAGMSAKIEVVSPFSFKLLSTVNILQRLFFEPDAPLCVSHRVCVRLYAWCRSPMQELTAGIPCVIDDVVEITSEAQIFSLPLLAQVGDGGDDEPVPSPGPAKESKAAASLRSEVTQASAAMAVATKVRSHPTMATVSTCCLHDVLSSTTRC